MNKEKMKDRRVDMEEFIKDRNKAFESGNENEVRAYCEKYKINIPKDRKVFLAGMHKAICNLYMSDDNISIEQYDISYTWLVNNGYSPSIQ